MRIWNIKLIRLIHAWTKCSTFSNKSPDFVNGWKPDKRYLPTVGMSNAVQAWMRDPGFCSRADTIRSDFHESWVPMSILVRCTGFK